MKTSLRAEARAECAFVKTKLKKNKSNADLAAISRSISKTTRRYCRGVRCLHASSLGPIKRECIARETATVVAAAMNIEERRRCGLD